MQLEPWLGGQRPLATEENLPYYLLSFSLYPLPATSFKKIHLFDKNSNGDFHDMETNSEINNVSYRKLYH